MEQYCFANKSRWNMFPNLDVSYLCKYHPKKGFFYPIVHVSPGVWRIYIEYGAKYDEVINALCLASIYYVFFAVLGCVILEGKDHGKFESTILTILLVKHWSAWNLRSQERIFLLFNRFKHLSGSVARDWRHSLTNPYLACDKYWLNIFILCHKCKEKI